MKLLDQIEWPAPGKYVVAVSGGVDSVVLLHLLSSHTGYDLIVAHADHGWRHDSSGDHDLVRKLADDLGLAFESTKLKLRDKSEATARVARYEFLEQIRKKFDANAIITAHHWDDRQETSLFNLLRGTNRHGLAPLKSAPKLLRPLITLRKDQIVDYAKGQNLHWREDATNTDTAYTRNFIRHQLLPFARQDKDFDKQFAEMLAEADELNQQIDGCLKDLLDQNAKASERDVSIPTKLVAELSLPVLRHLLLFMARKIDASAEIDSLALDQAALQLKTGRLKTSRTLNNQLNVQVGNDRVAIALIRPK